MLFKPAELGNTKLDPAVLKEDFRTCKKIGPCGIGKKALYLLRDEGDADAAAFAEQVKARLLDKVSGVDVSVGNPVSSVEELEKVGAAELGVVFAQVKRTKRECLRRWRQICSRYCLPLAGAVAVERCW